MSVSLRLIARGSGNGRSPSRIEVRKSVDDERSFQHEVRWLARARDHRVARLHTVEPIERTYSTLFAGSHTLTTAARSPELVRRHIESLGSVLASLHRAGLTHGAVRPDHVVLSRDGIVLISPAAGCSPGRSGRPTPATDVAGLGRTVSELAELFTLEPAVDGAIVERWRSIGAALESLARRSEATAVDVRRLLRHLDTGTGRRFRLVRRPG